MRMWEVEDNKAIPSNLVREQDFILRVRRFHRLETPQLVVNILLTQIPAEYSDRGPLEAVQQRLQTYAETWGGSYAEMSCGDVFLCWPETSSSRLHADSLMNVVLPAGVREEDLKKFRFAYHLPADYTALRERINAYIEAARAATASSDTNTPAQLLLSDAARGPLTAWSVNQIQKLLTDLDMRRYIRTQPVYERAQGGRFTPLFDECFIGIQDLQRAHFPRLDIFTPQNLFQELCQALDGRLLTNLANHFETVKGHKLSFNLSVSSVLGPVFSVFAHAVPPKDRSLVAFEMQRTDMFQDFEMTLNALSLIRKEGFQIIIDGITPELVQYINLQLFDADYIKINVGKERARLLNSPDAHAALAKIPPQRLIFYHCDNEPALVMGRSLGITRYQGWLIDDLARSGSDPHTQPPTGTPRV